LNGYALNWMRWALANMSLSLMTVEPAIGAGQNSAAGKPCG